MALRLRYLQTLDVFYAKVYFVSDDCSFTRSLCFLVASCEVGWGGAEVEDGEVFGGGGCFAFVESRQFLLVRKFCTIGCVDITMEVAIP